MRIAWFTAGTGEGPEVQVSRRAVSALHPLAEVTVFSHRPCEGFPAGLACANFVEDPAAVTELGTFDVVFYNLGRHAEDYGAQFAIAEQVPGIVVLHDASMLDFFLERFVQQVMVPRLFSSIMLGAHGAAGWAAAERILAEGIRTDDRQRFPLLRDALKPATAVVVHSHWVRGRVREVWSGLIHETWVPAPATGTVLPGRSDEALRVAVRGTQATTAAIADAVAADPYLRGRCEVVSGEGEIAVILTDPWDEASALAGTDALGSGRAVIALDAGPLAELPDELVLKVRDGDRTELMRHLRELVHNPARLQALERAGIEFAALHCAQAYADGLLRFVRTAVETATVRQIAANVAQELSTLGIEPGSEAAARVRNQIAELVGL